MPEPLYTADNCRIAYQLHWSLTLFARAGRGRTKPSGGNRCNKPSNETAFAFSNSSRRNRKLASCLSVASLRPRRRISSGRSKDGSNTLSAKLSRSFGGGITRSPASATLTMSHCRPTSAARCSTTPRLIHGLRISRRRHNSSIRTSILPGCGQCNGRFTHSLHLVLENAGRLCDSREEWLAASLAMVSEACGKKGWLLSRLGLVGNHLHVLAGCDVAHARVMSPLA